MYDDCLPHPNTRGPDHIGDAVVHDGLDAGRHAVGGGAVTCATDPAIMERYSIIARMLPRCRRAAGNRAVFDLRAGE